MGAMNIGHHIFAFSKARKGLEQWHGLLPTIITNGCNEIIHIGHHHIFTFHSTQGYKTITLPFSHDTNKWVQWKVYRPTQCPPKQLTPPPLQRVETNRFLYDSHHQSMEPMERIRCLRQNSSYIKDIEIAIWAMVFTTTFPHRRIWNQFRIESLTFKTSYIKIFGKMG